MRLIDADALHKEMWDKCAAECGYCPFESKDTHKICGLIDEMPTVSPVGPLIDIVPMQGLKPVDPEKQHGEWIVTSEDTEGIHHIKCPFCKYEKGSEFTPYIKVTFEKLPHFCENCGADMREEKRDEQTTD